MIWERHIREMKFIPVSDELIIEFLENIDEKRIQSISKAAYSSIKDMTLRAFKSFDFDTFLNTFKAYCLECGFHVEDKKSNPRSIVINHTLGIKFSNVIHEVFKLVLNEFHIQYSHKQTSRTVLIHINSS